MDSHSFLRPLGNETSPINMILYPKKRLCFHICVCIYAFVCTLIYPFNSFLKIFFCGFCFWKNFHIGKKCKNLEQILFSPFFPINHVFSKAEMKPLPFLSWLLKNDTSNVYTVPRSKDPIGSFSFWRYSNYSLLGPSKITNYKNFKLSCVVFYVFT